MIFRMARPSDRSADPEALLGECARNQIADLAMVIDDQNVRRSLHIPNIDQSFCRLYRMCVGLWLPPRLTHFVTIKTVPEKLW